MSDLDHIVETPTGGEEIDNYAFKITSGKTEIKIYADGHVEGWPLSWTNGGQFIIMNRIPAQIAAAEQVGYALGYEQARSDLSTKATVLNEKLPR